MPNPVEKWKSERHPFTVWADVERHVAARNAPKSITRADLERMKWYGFFYRKRDKPGRFMNRIRVTANELTADQAREIAMIAYEFGHGIIDVTTRANLQIQGLDLAHIPVVAKRLEQVGLTSKQTGHDNVLNVFGHPFSGLVSDEWIDTRSLCRQITDVFLNDDDYADLPRKINICVSGTKSHAAHLWTQDLAFLATEYDGRIMFQVLLAGTQGQNPHLAWHLPVLVAPEHVVGITRAIVDLFRAKGERTQRNRTRLRFLVERIGVGGVLDWLEQSLPYPLIPCVREPVPTAVRESFVGWFPQRDRRQEIFGLNVPLGRLTWRQLEGLAVLSKRYGQAALRTTHAQGVAVPSIPTGFKEVVATASAALGLSHCADELDHNTLVCTGSQFCNIAVTETKRHMQQLIESLRKKTLKLHGIRIHMSGCPSSCAQHFTADIGLKGVRVRRLLGTREGFDVYLGGGLAGDLHLGMPYKLGVDIDQLPNLIEQVVAEYYAKHRSARTFSAYWRERLQEEDARQVGDREYHLPTWACDRCAYEHHGEDPPVFCPSCVGLRRHFARMETTPEDHSAGQVSG